MDCKCGRPTIEGKVTCGRVQCGSSTGSTMSLAEMEAVARHARAAFDAVGVEVFGGQGPGPGPGPRSGVVAQAILLDGMPCPYCSADCKTRGQPEPTIKDDHVVCLCPCHRLAQVLAQHEAEWERPPFAAFAKSLMAEARWSAELHGKDGGAGQAESDQRSLVRLAEEVVALGKRLGFV
jgi:hypothetical protein